jgi:release factor glutamine methyltransferase
MKPTAWLPAVNMTNSDLGNWVDNAVVQLKERSESPSVEVHAIASHVLQKPREWIFAHPETILNEPQLHALDKALHRLMDGEPLAYITGMRSFYGLDFVVDKRVLVPRPETELLVDLAIDWLKKNPDRKRVVDVGTGSGVIAVTLAHHFPDLIVSAIDTSAEALKVAQLNAALHKVVDRIKFIQNDLLEGLNGQFDLVLANLPYIPEFDVGQLPDLRHEPRAALDGGSDGLRIIEKLILESEKNMAQNSCMILEIQYNQWEAVQDLALIRNPKAIISIHHDLAALPRVIRIQNL